MKQGNNLRAWRLATVAVLVALSAGVLPSAGAQEEPPLLDISLGTPYESDFNDDAGGFEASPVPPPTVADPAGTWAHGAPTSGPGFAFSGSNVWATNLGGLYGGSECSALLSPAITIPAGGSASVGFQEWHHMDQTSFTANDAGILLATTDGGTTYSVVEPDGGYTSKNISFTARNCFFNLPSGTLGVSGPAGTTPPPAAYAPITADLSSFAGQTVQFAIGFASTSTTHRAGWYIDDFTTTVNNVSSTETFEAGDGGFAIVGLPTGDDPLGWSHGAPAVGPSASSNLDGSMLGTGLADGTGTYGYNECATLTSPEINLGNIPEGLLATEATLRWQQWYQTSSVSAGGVVQVDAGDGFQTITPVGGYPEDAVSSTLEGCLGVDSPAFDGTLQADGADLADLEADLSPFIGSTIRVRYLFASSSSSPFGEGWYIDNVGVDLALVVAGIGIPEPTPPGEPNLDPEAIQNWTSGGENSTWEYGTAVEGGGPAGETGWATNLDGDHEPSECSYIESPAVAGVHVASDPTLVFDHWYIIGSRFSTGGSAFDGGALFVSTDLGGSWQYMALPEYTSTSTSTTIEDCLGQGNDAAVFVGNKPTMDSVTVNLSSLAGAPTVKFRWLFSASTVVHNEGWFVKNVKVGGQQLLP